MELNRGKCELVFRGAQGSDITMNYRALGSIDEQWYIGVYFQESLKVTGHGDKMVEMAKIIPNFISPEYNLKSG